MFKLVAVGGKIRGQEFVLEPGENTFGRSPDCGYPLTIQGVSKKHMSLTVNDDVVYLEDLGSSNGTFVNGKITKKKTVGDGDKIALPNVIFQLVYVKENKVIVKKKVLKASEEDEEIGSALDEEPPIPDNLVLKLVHLFKWKLMPVLYGFNESYEWKHLIGILLSLFVACGVAMTIFPALDSVRKILEAELKIRGVSYANQIARINARALQSGNLDKLDTSFLRREEGVVSYELVDLDKMVLSPPELYGKVSSDPFTDLAFDYVTKKYSEGKYHGQSKSKNLGGGEIGFAKGILVANARTGQQELVGIVTIRFAPKSLEAEAVNKRATFLQAFVVVAVIGIFFYGFFFFLTLRPLEEMRFQIEDCLRGKRKELESKQLWDEVRPLRNTVNSLIQRIRELNNEDEGDFAEMEEDAPYVRLCQELAAGAQGPVIIMNSEKNIENINLECEDLVGFRESSAQGSSILDNARDQGFAATVIELCDDSANNDGTSQQGMYELQGADYNIYVKAMIGRDNFAKAFYVTFVKDD